MNRKTVLLDIREIVNPTSGFGQICKNYAEWYGRIADPDLDFVLLTEPRPLAEVDLWHATNQQQLKHRRGKCRHFVLTIHDLNYLTEKNWLRQMKHNFILQRAINKADAVVTISNYVARQVEQKFNMKGKPVRVIYNGVEDISQQAEARPAFVGDRPFFFTIGQIRKKKNHHLLVDMMRHLPDFDLYISGDDHFKHAETVRRHIDDLPTANAHLTGKITAEEKVWLYRHCQALLFPSVGEGFGLPAIEAMQFGKPVFIANATCLPEICDNHALIWPDLNPASMARFVEDRLPLFDDIKAQACKDHAATFSYQRHIDAYIQLYKQILQSCD